MRLSSPVQHAPQIEIIPTQSSAILRKMPSGWFVFEIRGARDIPGWDREAIAKGMTDPQKIAAEVDGDWSASAGKLVYPEFNQKIHVSEEPIPFDRDLPLLCGWDFAGNSGYGTPAFCPAQLNAFGQLLVWEAKVPPENTAMGIYEFGEWVYQYLCDFFGDEQGRPPKDLRHFGDPAGKALPTVTDVKGGAAEARSQWDILRRGVKLEVGFDEYTKEPIYVEKPGWGWIIQPGAVSVTERLQHMHNRLSTITPDGYAAFVVDPRATYVIDALAGGYHYRQRADGSFEHDPHKNWFSHGLNALEYIASRLRGARPLPGEDDDGAPVTGFRSVRRSPGRRFD